MTLFEETVQIVKASPNCSCQARIKRHARLILLMTAKHLREHGYETAAVALELETRQ